MRELNEFMVQRQLPPSMQTKIRAFFQYRHLSGKWGFDENALLREMSPTMRASVILYNNKDAIRRVPWFADGEPDFLFRICACLHTIYCAPGELLIREGELGQEMYLLIKRQVEIFNQTGTFHTVIEARDASEAKYFGEVSALFGDRRLASVKALSFLDVLSISKNDLDEVLEFFPALRARIRSKGSRRRRRRIFVKVIAVVRLMNLARTDKRVTTDWTVEDLLNLKASFGKRQTGSDIIDPTLADLNNMSLGHINEMASVGALSSVRGGSVAGKSRRSSIASLMDLGLSEKDILADVMDKPAKTKSKQRRHSYSDMVKQSDPIPDGDSGAQRSNNSYSHQASAREGDSPKHSTQEALRVKSGSFTSAGSHDRPVSPAPPTMAQEPNTPKTKSANPTLPGGASVAAHLLGAGSGQSGTPRSPRLSRGDIGTDFDRDRLLLGSVQSMLQSFKEEMVSVMDSRYAPKQRSLDAIMGQGQAMSSPKSPKAAKAATSRIIDGAPSASKGKK